MILLTSLWLKTNECTLVTDYDTFQTIDSFN